MNLVSHFTDQEPKASVLLAHGFGEHSGRYGEFIDVLRAAGYDVWTFDFASHGTSEGRRACVNVGALIAQHLEARRDFALAARTEKKHLFGHSMGGMITLASTLLMPHHVDSVAVTGPGLRPLPGMPIPVMKAATVLARFFPGLGTVQLDHTKLSHDPEVAASYGADPLVFDGKVPLLTASTMAVQGDYTLKNAPLLRVPTLILHGGDDSLTDVRGSEEFVARANGQFPEPDGSSEVDGTPGYAELRVIEGAYHELLNEVERAEIAAEIVEWFDADRHPQS